MREYLNNFRRERHISAFGIAAAFVMSACHRALPAVTPSTVSWPAEQHCWWAAYRTTMVPDSVAGRLRSAFTRVGFSDGRWGSLGDTAWAQAGPTVLSDSARTGIYAARAVAIRHGDSTRFRVFVGVPNGAAEGGGQLIKMCGDVMRASAVRAVAPREQEADDSLLLWRRRR